MILHRWGEIAYVQARERMQSVHAKARQDGQNHLILCAHPAVFTVGSDEKKRFDVATVECDRGGSITCHSPGQNIYYFCFQVPRPAKFYKRVVSVFEAFFRENLSKAFYDKEQPGFYIGNRKIASLGFRYSQGVSLHGVALNVDVDLALHSQVSPCNLTDIVPTSLANEGCELTQAAVDAQIIGLIEAYFDDAV